MTDNSLNTRIFLFYSYAMEMHLVFFKSSCKTIFEAESQQNGYVTLAYVFDVSNKCDNIINLHNPSFQF